MQADALPCGAVAGGSGRWAATPHEALLGGTISLAAAVIRCSERCSARALVPLYEAG